MTGLGDEQAAQLVAAITLVTGVLFLLVAVFRMGWIASSCRGPWSPVSLPAPRSTSSIGELPKLTGTSPTARTPGRSSRRGSGPRRYPLDDAAGRGSSALAVILGLGSRHRRSRARSCSWSAGCSPRVCSTSARDGVALVGTCRAACPRPQLPDARARLVRTLPTIVIAAFALLLIGFSQTAGDAGPSRPGTAIASTSTRSRSPRDGERRRGLFQGMPVSTSLSASSLNESAGARTPVASLATGALVLAHADLARAAVLRAAEGRPGRDHHRRGRVRDDRPAEFRRLRRVKRFDFWIAVAAILGVLSGGRARGVVIGIVLSLVWLINVATRPAMPISAASRAPRYTATSTRTPTTRPSRASA